MRLLCVLVLAVMSPSVHSFDLGRGLSGAGGALEDVGRMWQQQELIEQQQKALLEQQHRQRMEQLEREHEMRLEYERQRQLEAQQQRREAARRQELARQQEQAEAEKARQADVARRNAEVAKIDRAHPGWVSLVNTPAFDKWLTEQPGSVRNLAASYRGEDSILLLDLYKRDTARKSGKSEAATRKNAAARASSTKAP